MASNSFKYTINALLLTACVTLPATNCLGQSVEVRSTPAVNSSLSSSTTTSLNGFVVDENDAVVPGASVLAVSYTHLTLPTILLV